MDTQPATSTQGPALDPMMDLPAVEAATTLKKSALYALIAKGEFPRPVRLTGRRVGWRSSSIAAWLRSRNEAA